MGGILDTLTRKQPKPKGFRYKPLYFQKDKAEFMAYVEKLRAERDARDRGEYRPDFRGKFSSSRIQGEEYRKKMLYSNLRLLIVLGVLCTAAFYLLHTGLIARGIDQFLTIFSKKNGSY